MKPLTLYCALLISCAPEPRFLKAEAPVMSAELISDTEVVATLAPGSSARAVAGRDLFGEFEPNLSLALARLRFGEPNETIRSGDETLYVWKSSKGRVAICEQRGSSSASGDVPRSYELRAWPDEGYLSELPRTIRELVTRRAGKHSIIVASMERSDWNVDILVSDKKIQFVRARSRSDFTN